MSNELQPARVAGPIRYVHGDTAQELPWGPCLLERIDRQHVDIIWGESGEHCAVVPLAEVKRAAKRGDLVLIN